jgi:hypothetical protein
MVPAAALNHQPRPPADTFDGQLFGFISPTCLFRQARELDLE